MSSPEGPVERLRAAIQSRRAICILGAGVAAATTDRPELSSWTKLIESGVSYALASGDPLPVPDFEEWVRSDLRHDAVPDSLVSAAEKVHKALRVVPGRFADWLRSVFAGPAISDRQLIDAICNLRAPIVTVNYDSLIELATGRTARTWLQPREAQLILNGAVSDVLHLHGHWTQPESIIFGDHSYGAHSSNEAIQALQRASGLANALVFIGCGGTIRDPNFESLRTWLTGVIPDSAVRNFLLVTATEATAARGNYGTGLEVVTYGETHSDLVPFLARLAPSALEHQSADLARTSIDLILDSLRATSLIAEHVGNVDLARIDQILIPPVLLPVSPEQFAATKRTRELAHTVERIDATELAGRAGIHLVVADEGSGLTTTLRWLAATSASTDPSPPACPVSVDGRALSAGPKPLERLVRRELRLLDRSVPIPRCVVALDNLTAFRPGFDRLLEELAERRDAPVFLGCKRGFEVDLLQRTRAAGLAVSVVYVGRMNTADIELAANLVDPSRAAYLVKRTVELIQREHLPRTPQTVLLIVNMLLQGEAVLATASGTALLDAWIEHLLGRGDLRDDARFSLDAHGRASILSYLAERFVTEGVGALPQATVIACFETYFQSVGWAESPSDLLRDLADRRILTVTPTGVYFAQSGYLHLFAAHRASEDQMFRERLFERPLYYDSILCHYAALRRNDATVVRTVAALIKDSVVSAQRGRNFSPSEVEGARPADSLEYLVTELDLATQVGEQMSELKKPDALELADDHDRVPFPADDLDAEPPSVRVLRVLSLVSSVLRDSEQVEDLALKEQVLASALALWGRLVDALEVDDDFNDTVRYLATMVADLMDGVSERERERFIDGFVDTGAMMVGFAMMTSTLTTRKLLLALDHCFARPEFRMDPGASIMGALLAYEIRGRGWTKAFRRVLADHPGIDAVQEVLRPLALARYLDVSQVDDEENRGLIDFLADQTAGTYLGPTTPQEKQTRDRVVASLRSRRNQIEVRSRYELKAEADTSLRS